MNPIVSLQGKLAGLGLLIGVLGLVWIAVAPAAIDEIYPYSFRGAGSGTDVWDRIDMYGWIVLPLLAVLVGIVDLMRADRKTKLGAIRTFAALGANLVFFFYSVHSYVWGY